MYLLLLNQTKILLGNRVKSKISYEKIRITLRFGKNIRKKGGKELKNARAWGQISNT
jgi:hypothetical protein